MLVSDLESHVERRHGENAERVVVDGNGGELSVFFDVVQTYGNEFILGDDILNSFTYDDEGILFDQGEVRIYWRE